VIIVTEKIKYFFEKGYPYIFSLIICIFLYKYKVINTTYEDVKDALEATLTVVALIIGFVGTILPIIMGIKSESEYVKAVMESDSKALFVKYIRGTVNSGLLLIGVTVALYMEKPSVVNMVGQIYIWVYIFIVFLFSTYRCISIILKLMFPNERIKTTKLYEKNAYKSQHERDLEKENSI